MKEILERLVNGEINVDEAENLINANNILEFDEIAKLDIKRNQRAGFPEAVFGFVHQNCCILAPGVISC